MSIEYTVTFRGQVSLPDGASDVAQYVLSHAAERPREAVEGASRRVEFARKALRHVLAEQRQGLRLALTQRAGHPWASLADWERGAARWESLVDVEGHPVPGVVTGERHPDIAGAISVRVEPERATAVIEGRDGKFTLETTPALPPAQPARAGSIPFTPSPGEHPVAAALARLRALGLALGQPLPDLGGLWRVLRPLPPVRGAITVPVPERGVELKLDCTVGPFKGRLLRISPDWLAERAWTAPPPRWGAVREALSPHNDARREDREMPESKSPARGHITPSRTAQRRQPVDPEGGDSCQVGEVLL